MMLAAGDPGTPVLEIQGAIAIQDAKAMVRQEK